MKHHIAPFARNLSIFWDLDVAPRLLHLDFFAAFSRKCFTLSKCTFLTEIQNKSLNRNVCLLSVLLHLWLNNFMEKFYLCKCSFIYQHGFAKLQQLPYLMCWWKMITTIYFLCNRYSKSGQKILNFPVFFKLQNYAFYVKVVSTYAK